MFPRTEFSTIKSPNGGFVLIKWRRWQVAEIPIIAESIVPSAIAPVGVSPRPRLESTNGDGLFIGSANSPTSLPLPCLRISCAVLRLRCLTLGSSGSLGRRRLRRAATLHPEIPQLDLRHASVGMMEDEPLDISVMEPFRARRRRCAGRRDSAPRRYGLARRASRVARHCPEPSVRGAHRSPRQGH